ncbi:MAG: glycosyltransferase, partial [Chitinispirillales bacterium]|nr:glycosyltransferase [Chitinispirillales bacterium]
MKNSFFSLIVTVYNLEEYLSACLDSILAQTFNDYEILLVNNNSSDNSGKICEYYAKRDNRIRYFALDGNSVMGAAHRCGLAHAFGDYIWFIDGDDLLPKNACEKVAVKLSETKSDVIFGGFSTFLDGEVANFIDTPYDPRNINKRSKDEALRYLVEKQQPVLATWRLIYSRDLYNRVLSHERFTKLTRDAHQDTAFGVMTLVSADAICYINDVIYNY